MSEHQDTTTTSPQTTAAPIPAPVSQEQPSATTQSSTQPPAQVSAQVSTPTSSPSVTATAAVAAVTPINGSSRSGEELSCLWQGCSEKCPTAELLYEHVCERHVGRKSTNNLNLTCQWGSCRTTTVKRDHITSHIRVHVPLKPHKCDFCGKAFKRPQDLKKHVKTHADDSVLVRSPEPGTRNPDMMFSGNAKGYGPTAHYFEPALNPVSSHGYHSAPQYYQSHPPPHQPPNPSSYGNVYYALNQGHEPGHTSYESKKRSFDALNEFFGDLKRRQFDPSSYNAVGQRLVGLQSLSLPMLSGGPVPEYQTMPAPLAVGGGGYTPGGHSAPAYHLPPMSNVRTKNDLVNIDQFLQQMQDTIYENDDHVAAAGVAQPGAHYVHGGMSYRTTNSPPIQLPPTHATATSSAATATNTAIHSPPTGTPALTPPSSAQSYTSGRSPVSVTSGTRLSPIHHEDSSSMYPRLPTVSDSMAASYPATSSAAPPSTLGGIFDYDRRRYTGGTLQRARPEERRLSVQMDLSHDDKEDGERTPVAKEHGGSTSPGRISASLIDPALHSGSSTDAEAALRTAQAATEVAERADTQWVEKVRLLEYLRNYIASRLERGEFESEPEQHSLTNASHGLDGHMEDVVTDHTIAESKSTPLPSMKSESDDVVVYPTLRGLDADGDSKMRS